MPQEWGESDPCYIANSEVKSNNINLPMLVPLKHRANDKQSHECRKWSCGHSALPFTRWRPQSATKPKCDLFFFAQLLNPLLGEQFSCPEMDLKSSMLLYELVKCCETHMLAFGSAWHPVNHTCLVACMCPQDIHSLKIWIKYHIIPYRSHSDYAKYILQVPM